MMSRFLPIFIVVVLLSTPITAAGKEPAKPGKRDRCPVCGMFVAPYPDWIASLSFSDDSVLYFDGAKDLLRYYFSLPSKEDSRTRADISDIYVTDYYSGQTVSAKHVFFISGSDIYGPMGAELIPVTGESAAASFFLDHKGQKMLRFEQLSKDHLPVEK